MQRKYQNRFIKNNSNKSLKIVLSLLLQKLGQCPNQSIHGVSLLLLKIRKFLHELRHVLPLFLQALTAFLKKISVELVFLFSLRFLRFPFLSLFSAWRATRRVIFDILIIRAFRISARAKRGHP